MAKFRKCTELDVDLYNKMSSKINSIMHSKKISRIELSEKLNVKLSSLNRMFSGQQRFTLSFIIKFCKYFDLDLNTILTVDELQLYDI